MKAFDDSYDTPIAAGKKVAVSPGIGFGHYGDQYVRIALIENEKRIRQAAKNIKRYLKTLE
jgi:alanine-synthesizing transaminase